MAQTPGQAVDFYWIICSHSRISAYTTKKRNKLKETKLAGWRKARLSEYDGSRTCRGDSAVGGVAFELGPQGCVQPGSSQPSHASKKAFKIGEGEENTVSFSSLLDHAIESHCDDCRSTARLWRSCIHIYY